MAGIETDSAEGSPAAPPARRAAGAFDAAHLGRRLASALLAVWGATTLVFFMILATGSPLDLFVGPTGSAEDIARVNALYGFDRPLHEQYLKFLASVARFDFPDSLRFNISAFRVLLPAIPMTVLLGGAALVLGVATGLAVGHLSVFGRWRLLREGPLLALTVVQAMPVFVVGILLVLVFALRLGWLPTGGSRSWQHLVLPTVTLSLLVAAPVARLFRASILRTLGADHVRTALVKDVGLRRVRIAHVSVNALLPVVSLIGLQTGSLLGGAVLTEATFGWPGVGTTIVNAVATKDYPVVLAAVILVTAVVSLANLLADLGAAALDPRLAVTA